MRIFTNAFDCNNIRLYTHTTSLSYPFCSRKANVFGGESRRTTHFIKFENLKKNVAVNEMLFKCFAASGEITFWC